MTTPPCTLQDVSFKDRTKLQKLIYERAMLNYTFSYDKLLRAFISAMNKSQQAANLFENITIDEVNILIRECIVAWDDTEAKVVKDDLNDKISAIYTENGIEKTLRHTDPFGNGRDIIMMEGTATSFSKTDAAQIAVADYGIAASDFQEILARATKQTKYVTVQVRKVAENGGVDDSLPGQRNRSRKK